MVGLFLIINISLCNEFIMIVKYDLLYLYERLELKQNLLKYIKLNFKMEIWKKKFCKGGGMGCLRM